MLFPTTAARSHEDTVVRKADMIENAVKPALLAVGGKSNHGYLQLYPGLQYMKLAWILPIKLPSYAKTVVRPMMMQLKATHGLNLSPVQWQRTVAHMRDHTATDRAFRWHPSLLM